MNDGVVEGVTTQAHETVRAQHVVGADGLRSVIARKLGAVATPGVRKLSLTAHVDRDLQCGDFGEMHVGDGVCAGVAPLDREHTRWNLTVVADADRFGRAAARDARAFFIDAIATLPALQRIIAQLDDIGPLHASGPFDSPRRAITYPGASLVGDAAGYFDPFTGQGIYHGMRAAEMLAKALTSALRDGTRDRSRGRTAAPVVADGYAHDARRLTRGPRRLQKAIDMVLSRPRLADRAIRRLAHAPAAAQAILDVTGDMAPVRSLFSTHVARSLMLPESP
jgi:flavin-dependent dehydrogenase